MRLPPENPFFVACCNAILRASSLLVPEQGQPIKRSVWLADWRARAFSRWQFLHDTGLWSIKEAVLLLMFCLSSVLDAIAQILQQEPLRNGATRIIRSPLSCVLVLIGLLGVIALASGGLPATRDLLFKRYGQGSGKIVFVWLHTLRGGGDHPLPSDVIPAWAKYSKQLEGAASFRASHLPVTPEGGRETKALVVKSGPEFFQVLQIQPSIGDIASEKSVVLSFDAWCTLFHADPRVIGSTVTIDKQVFPVRAVLPEHVEPLTRQPALYLLIPNFNHGDVYAVLRVGNGVSQRHLNVELVQIAEDKTYDYLQGQLRYSYAQSALLTPLWSFAVAAFASGLLLMAAFRIKWHFLREAVQTGHRRTLARQAAFFSLKTGLGLLCVFTACLEWSRSSSAILFGNFDPASGPFLLWLYIMGSMGVFFWTVVDQKARCRDCLRLLAFPVRIGSPGNLLLDWSGTEFCCSEGHGILHVPHLAPSWSDSPDHWISLDDSWHSLFHDERRQRE